MSWLPTLIKACYFLAALLFILGLKRMSSPRTARGGIVWAGVGMLLAVLATFALPGMHNRGLILAAVVIGVSAAWWTGRRVAMTAMPQMVALYNGMGGGAAAAIGAAELFGHVQVLRQVVMPDTSPLRPESWATDGLHPIGTVLPLTSLTPLELGLGVLGALIGSVSFSGSLIAFAKLQGWLDKRFVFPGQRLVNLLVLLAAVVCGVMLVGGHLTMPLIVAFFVLALLFGLMMTLPIGGADMPVVISLLNSYSGLAAASTGFVLNNSMLIIAGSLVGASGMILTAIMCKAMNRSLTNVLFAGVGSEAAASGGPSADSVYAGKVKSTSADEVAMLLENARRVVFVPGYGLAVSQAQHAVRQLANMLEARGATVDYGIHPVAGRMPGHMNVLLAEADVPYDALKDMDEVNPTFQETDVAIVIGANDVVNPVARTDPSSPIAGMPILDVDKARTVVVVKRSLSPGFAGIPNPLFAADNALMFFSDGKKAVNDLIAAVKEL